VRGVLKGGTRHEATHLYSHLTALQPRSPRSDPRCSTAAPRASLKRPRRLTLCEELRPQVCHRRGLLQNQSESSFGQASTPCLIEVTTHGREVSVSLLSQALFPPRPLLLFLQLSHTRWRNICLLRGSELRKGPRLQSLRNPPKPPVFRPSRASYTTDTELQVPAT
jgi:hypothetical protein